MSDRTSPIFPVLAADCLDQWLNDFGGFRVDFLRYCNAMCRARDYHFDWDQKALEIAHTNWKARCDYWKNSLVAPTSNGLSHLKIMALLLDQLASVEWVKNLYDYDGSTDGITFSGTPAEKAESRKDINAGRGTFLAYQFVMAVLNWFEKGRSDRRSQFAFRVTADLEHDLLVYLLSQKREEMAIFLILKAIYARD